MRGQAPAVVPKPEIARPDGVFANTEVDMAAVDVVGFDYDFTLCSYTPALAQLLYDQAKAHLVDVLRYPAVFRSFQYDASFAIRGLLYDTEKGLLVKMSYLNTLTVVFRGRTRLSEEEVLQAYDGCLHVSPDYRDRVLRGMVDLFSLSEACLLADVIQYFCDHGIPYEPRSVSDDVRAAIEHVHDARIMHEAVYADLPRFLHRSPMLSVLLQRFRSERKHLFLLTNSPFRYINAGLCNLVGPDWRDLFDVVITDGRKPRCA